MSDRWRELRKLAKSARNVQPGHWAWAATRPQDTGPYVAVAHPTAILQLLAERDQLLAALKRMLALNHGDITREGLAEMRAAYAAAERLIAGDKTE